VSECVCVCMSHTHVHRHADTCILETMCSYDVYTHSYTYIHISTRINMQL